MTAFVLGLVATYVVLGIAIVVAVRISHSVISRLPVWGLLGVYLGVAGLLTYTLAIGNVVAVMAALTIVVALVMVAAVKVVPRAVPPVFDAVLRPFRREFHRSR